MIGKTQIYKRSMVPYFYIGGDGDGQLPGFQPPTGGCFIRCDVGSGGSGSITIYGTYGGEDVDETISSFDSEGIGIGTQRFATITSFDISLTDSESVTVYPADEMGDTIQYNTYSTSYIRGDWSYSSKSSGNRLIVNVGGEKVEAEVEVLYNTNYTLNRDDQLGIDGLWYKVERTEKISRSARKAYLTNTGEIFSSASLEGIELNQAQVQALIEAALAAYTPSQTALTITKTAGAAITQYDSVAIDPADNRVVPALADSSDTMPAIGIAQSTVADGESVTVIVAGESTIRSDSLLTVDGAVFVSASSAGKVTQTAPVSEGTYQQQVGNATTTTKIMVNPQQAIYRRPS